MSPGNNLGQEFFCKKNNQMNCDSVCSDSDSALTSHILEGKNTFQTSANTKAAGCWQTTARPLSSTLPKIFSHLCKIAAFHLTTKNLNSLKQGSCKMRSSVINIQIIFAFFPPIINLFVLFWSVLRCNKSNTVLNCFVYDTHHLPGKVVVFYALQIAF